MLLELPEPPLLVNEVFVPLALRLVDDPGVRLEDEPDVLVPLRLAGVYVVPEPLRLVDEPEVLVPLRLADGTKVVDPDVPPRLAEDPDVPVPL